MAEAIISGDSVLNDSRKDLAEEENGFRTFSLGAAWSFDSELFETMVLQADVVLDSGRTETAGGVEAVQILVDAVTQGFPDSRAEVASLDSPWSRFGQWSLGQGSLKSLVADSCGMDQHVHFGSRKRASSCRYDFARRLSVRSLNSESPVLGTARRVVFLSRDSK